MKQTPPPISRCTEGKKMYRYLRELFIYFIPTLLSCINLQVIYLKQAKQPLPIPALVWQQYGRQSEKIACSLLWLSRFLMFPLPPQYPIAPRSPPLPVCCWAQTDFSHSCGYLKFNFKHQIFPKGQKLF